MHILYTVARVTTHIIIGIALSAGALLTMMMGMGHFFRAKDAVLPDKK